MATLALFFPITAISSAAPPLCNREAHVWRVRLDETLDAGVTALSATEEARAARMKHEPTRLGFRRARAALRRVLGVYAQRDPADLVIAVDPRGKPFIDLPGAPQFNLSHSGALALIAVTRAAPVGVDLEFMRPLPRLADVAARFFASGEVAELMALPEAQRLDAFYACWTRKEAYVKAEGSGLANALAHFEVSLRPDEPAMLKTVRREAAAAKGFTMHAFRPVPDVWAAACVGAPDVSLAGFELALD